MDWTLTIGLVGLLQSCVLPGALVFLFLGLGRVAPPIPTILAISLTLNYAFVMLAVAVKLYSGALVWSLIVLECAALILLSWRRNWLHRPLTGISSAVSEARTALRERIQQRSLRFLLSVPLHAWALWIIADSSIDAYSHSMDGFDNWDAIQSWSAWAKELFEGHVPQSGHYPHLLPANYSISFVLTQLPDLTVFASSLDRLFFPATAIALYWFANRRGQPLLLLAVPLADAITSEWLQGHRHESLADMPVAFFATLSAVIYFAPNREPASINDDLLALAAASLTAFGAAATKQAGLFWALALLLIVIFDRVYHRPHRSNITSAQAAVAMSLMIAVSISWYAYVRYTLIEVPGNSEISYVTDDVFGGEPPLQRLLRVVQSLSVLSILCLGLSATLVAKPGYRLLALGGVFGYLLVWAFFFSYDNRNAALSLPLMALCAALGASKALERLIPASTDYPSTPRTPTRREETRLHGLGPIPLLAPAAALVAASALLFLCLNWNVSRADLFERQFYSEAENMGPATGDYLRVVARVVAAHPARVWSRDRYTCTLTSTRELAQCQQLTGRRSAASSWMPFAEDLTANLGEMDAHLRAGGLVVLVLDNDEAPPALTAEHTFFRIQDFNNFALWIGAPENYRLRPSMHPI